MGHSNILALDLGNRTGFAYRDANGCYSGTHDFVPKTSHGRGQRWLRFRQWLAEFCTEHNVGTIYYESVVFGHSGSEAANVFGGFVAVVEMVAEVHNLRLVRVPVPTVKKSWTGKGNADKDLMMAEAKNRGFLVVDSNAADALALLHLAIEREDEPVTEF